MQKTTPDQNPVILLKALHYHEKVIHMYFDRAVVYVWFIHEQAAYIKLLTWYFGVS